jgi:hypothetical protein
MLVHVSKRIFDHELHNELIEKHPSQSAKKVWLLVGVETGMDAVDQLFFCAGVRRESFLPPLLNAQLNDSRQLNKIVEFRAKFLWQDI